MPDFRFMLANFPDPEWEERKPYRRLRDHLVKLSIARLEREQPELAAHETNPVRRRIIFDDHIDIKAEAR